MTESGVVISVNNGFATIRIGRNSACASCGKCGMTENQKHVDVYASCDVACKVDDVVEIEIPEANTTKMALIAYGIPLLPAIMLLVLSLALAFSDWVSILMFFGGYMLGLLFVGLIDRAKKRKWAKQPVVVKVLLSKN